MNKLITVAEKFENKLGLGSKIDKSDTIPKKLQKIAKVEKKLQKKIAQQYKMINKVSEEVTVKSTNGKIPGIYLVCNDCEGRGKVITSNSTTKIKLASINDELSGTAVIKCVACKGKRVIKVADIRKCSEQQIAERAQYVKDKANDKALKKADKKKKKAMKTVDKAEAKL